MRAQNGSWSVVSESAVIVVVKVVKCCGAKALRWAETYERHDLLLNLLRQRDDLEE
jgi:hypothetical protein